jgi:anti-sigma factor RsiW
MSCRKAQEIDLAAYLVDPDQPAWTEFREHYPTCPDCAEEVAAWASIEASLRAAGDRGQEAHPAVEILARFEDDPRALTADEWKRVDQHTRECRQCADELAALREFDFSALETVPPATIGEAVRAMGQSAAELLRSLARWAVPGLGDEALSGFFGTREPDLVFQSREQASAESATAKGAPVAVLVAVGGEVAGSVFAVLAGESRIGRTKECEIRIPSESLSRVEASIRADSNALEITALHERTPVLVNGEPVRSGPLRDGDLLQIGSERFQIRGVTSTNAPQG